MATPDLLIRDGLRAYEWGRLRVAARAAWLVVPAVAICVASTSQKELSCCLGALVLAGAVYLRWRDRAGVRAAALGVSAGLALLLVGLLLVPWSAWWLALEVAVGAWVGGAGRVRLNALDAAQSTALAALAAALGCAGAPVSILMGAMGAVVVGALAGRAVRRT
ncbi:MAG: hypothetical protein ABTQ32_01990 [Myxococcaceae bacterium]